MVVFADYGALHERVFHIRSLLQPLPSGHFLVLVQAIENFFNLHVYFVNVLNTRIDLTRWCWLKSIRRIISDLSLSFRHWLLLYPHWVFNLAELLHKISIFFAVITESRNMLGFFPSASILSVLLGVSVDIDWFVLFDDIGWGEGISQRVSIGGIRIVRLEIGVCLFRSLIIAVMGVVFTMRGRIVLFLDLFHSHISPTVTGLARSIVGLRLWLRVIFGRSHRNPGDFIEAVLSLHFNNKNIILL